MFVHIHGNLNRQFKALELLYSLLEEELDLLCRRDTDAVSSLEFSIHELLRQLAAERETLKKNLPGASLPEYAGLLPDEEGREIRRLYHLIDSLEQHCSRQATQNAELSLALLDQSQLLLNFLYDHMARQPDQLYSPAGRIRQDRPAAAIYSGRF
jgi:flagellar biosynthesis/type III secretory pathway chaperone